MTVEIITATRMTKEDFGNGFLVSVPLDVDWCQPSIFGIRSSEPQDLDICFVASLRSPLSV